LPSEPPQLVPLQRVPEVVPGPVGHGGDQRFRCAGDLADAPRELEVRDLVSSADVVGLARRSTIECREDTLREVADEEPLPAAAAPRLGRPRALRVFPPRST